MKTVYKSIFFCICLMLSLSACDGKNEEMPPTGGLDHAEQLVAGTYTGTWTKTNLSDQSVETSAGSVVFSWNEDLGNNVAAIAADSETKDFLSLSKDISACNISKLSSGILTFWNVYPMNPFGVQFTGKVTPEGVATMNYNKIIRIRVNGRPKEVEFAFSFSGSKQH